jgi:ankyrin repeat protein
MSALRFLLVLSLVLIIMSMAWAVETDDIGSLFKAVRDGNLRRVQILLKRNPELASSREKKMHNKTPLFFAASSGHGEITELLIADGADVNARDILGCSPLHEVTKSDIAELLISKGADVNAGLNRAGTPLHRAAMCRAVDATWDSCELPRVLISHGALVNARDQNGETPLHEAALLGNIEIVDLLISRGA